MNAIAKASFASVAALAGAQSAFAAITTGSVDARLRGREDDAPTAIQNLMSYITTFLYLIATAYALYGGFLILTSGGDEEKVKNGKKILLHGALGLLIIFLASSIVKFVIEGLVK